MLEFLRNIVTADFLPHGHCYFWRPELVWLHVGSDALIMAAYYSIPVTLVYLVRKRTDLAFHWMFLMFGAFIFACGTTHLMDVWTLWIPVYRLQGVIKLVTAALSVTTAILLVPLIPKVLAVPNSADLEAANQELTRQMAEREKAVAALQASEERFRAVSELTSDYAYAFRLEPDGTVVVEWVAGAFARITGYTPEEVEARGGGLSLVHPDDMAIAGERLSRLFSGQPDTSEFRIVTRSGEIRWVRETGRPTWDEAQQRLHIFAATQDITERNQAEEAARRHREELAHVLRVSTVGEMAAGLAHEINQPLSAIVSYAKGCVRRMRALPGTPGELIDTIEQIAAQAVRADQIVRHLRNLVRRREPRREPVAPNDLVREVAALVAGAAAGRGITIRLDLDASIPSIEVDGIQIEQVLLNLVRNGLEAMRTPDPEHCVLSIRTTMAAPDTFEVAVCDAGEGFAAETADKLFQPFFTTKPDGLGMGLSISRSIIEAHGGRLWATSNASRGCTFHFTLPVSNAERVAPA